MFEEVKVPNYYDLDEEDQYRPYGSRPYECALVLLDLSGVSRVLSEEYPGAEIDFGKLLLEAVDDRICIGAYAIHSDSRDMSRRKLLREVARCGFRTKPVPDEGCEDRSIGEAMAVIAQEYAMREWCNVIVLITGDSSDPYLVRSLQRKGKIVEVISFDEDSVADRTIPFFRLPLVRVVDSEEVGL